MRNLRLLTVLAALGSSSLGLSAEPPPSAPPPPPSMAGGGPKWQQTCENIPSGKLDQRVKDRGLAGWELVTVLGEGSGFIGCFKRPG